MKLYSENKDYKLYQGNMLDMLEVIGPNTIDSVVCDPPYELNFMNKGWDNAGVSFNKDTWKNCYEVLKPGGYLLAFGGSRTFHRIACAIEDAGFEIRDTIMWLYGSGFPKSMNIGLALDKKNGIDNRTGNIKTDGGVGGGVRTFSDDNYEWKREYEERIATNEWSGWGTALKPSFEPIIVARKPFKGSLVDNVIENGVGGINIDECRVGNETIKSCGGRKNILTGDERTGKGLGYNAPHEPLNTFHEGRFPANTILTYDETDFDEVCGGFPNTKSQKTNSKLLDIRGNNYNNANKNLDIAYERGYTDSGSASRYFYCAKASKKDRDEGLDTFEIKGAKELLNREENSDGASWNGKYSSGNAFAGCGAPKKNTHPTVKPTELMQYLVRLVTPNGGTVLDPFNGSGSTGKAVIYENKERNKGYKYIGIELTEEYLPIAQARLEYVCDLKEEEQPQTTIFDYI